MSAENRPLMDESRLILTIDAFRDALRDRAWRILGSSDLAEDALQETIWTLWRSGVPSTETRGWLMKTVMHRAMHAARCRRRRSDREASASRARDSFLTCPDPACEIERGELATALNAAWRRLAEPFREVFYLREIEGLEYDEIARRIDVPIGTVRSRLARARSAVAADPALAAWAPSY